jgi:hypothetical protein
MMTALSEHNPWVHSLQHFLAAGFLDRLIQPGGEREEGVNFLLDLFCFSLPECTKSEQGKVRDGERNSETAKILTTKQNKETKRGRGSPGETVIHRD